MGLLKHVLLPAFGLLHVAAAAGCSDLASWAALVGLPKDTVSSVDETSIRQNHMLGILRSFHITLAFLCGLSVTKESAHFRGQVILAEALLFAGCTIDAYRVGKGVLQYPIPALYSLVAAAGYVVNAMEPGIFTKDKNA